MTKYPRGRDIAVNWTLDLGGRTVDLAACDLSFEYFTGAGSKTVPASEYTIENNILSWTFPAEEQTAYGVYGLRLTATTPDGEELLFRNAGAFEIIHGEVDDEDRVLPMESSVETEQEEPEEEEPEEETPIYVSTSPIHVEKIPLGSNLTLRWRLLTPGDFDFRLEDCTLNLYYAAAGSGFNIATDYSLSTENGYVLTWNFHAEEQIRFGLYSLLLDVRKDGVKIATLVKDDAFSLVHRKGSIFPDRVLDFESVVTSIGGGALYSLIDVRNDGYSTVYRADGVTPAATGDLLIYDGALWHAIDAGSLPGLSALENELASLRVTTDGIFARVTDLEGDLGELWLTAREFGVRMSDAEGNIGQLTLTAREFGVRMSDAEGNIGQLSLTAQQFAVRMSDVEGNVGQLSLTAQQFGVRMSDIEGNVGELALTSEQFGVRMTDAEGNIGQLLLTADQFATRISDTEGNVSLLQQTATAITSRVSDAEGNISTLQQTATSLTSRIQSAEGSISTISQTAESIQLQVDNQAGDIATLQVSARGLTSRVADAEGNISILEQTASSLTSRITDAEGNISAIEQTASSLTTRISDAEGNISTLQQTATSLTSRISDTEGNVSTLQQTAASLTTRIGDAEGNISTLTQTVDGFETRVETVEGNMSSITQTVSGIEQRVQTAEGNITTLTTDVSGVTARVTTAEGNISQLRTDYNGIHASVETLSSNLSDYEGYVDGVLDGIQDQIDGAIDTWFYNGTPTLENLPASEWTTAALKNAHLGDVYYDNLTGYAYRFTKDGSTYMWTEITDSAVVDALARARNAQDTADHKRRVFLTTPYTPYDAGDLWVQGHTANNDGTIYRCVNSRASGDFVSTDWELASDLVNQNIMRANFDVLANAIIGTVAEYGSDGKITGETATQFAQTVSNISFSVTKVGSALLPTGIDIANQKITITTDNFFLQGNGVGSDTALQIVYRDNVPKISVANLDVVGLFNTQNWTDARLALYNEAVGAANTYADGVGEDAEEYADNAVSYFNTNVVAPLAGRVGATETDLTTLKAYRTAMLDNMTIIAGGLILSTEMELGTTVNDEWKVYSGISGIYDSTARGGGIAAWYGGPRVDHLANPSATEYAASLFRMDGSGYLAGGEIQWGAEGELIIHGTSAATPITIENAELKDGNRTLSVGDLILSIEDLLELRSWFVKEQYDKGDGQTHYRLKLVGSTTGIEGLHVEGHIVSEGDQIVIDGTPGGGGGGGGATTLAGLDDTNITNPQAGQILSWNGTKWVNTNAPTGSITSVSLAAGASNGTLQLVVNGTAQSDVAVTGLGSMAYKSSLAASDIPDLSGTYQPKDADLTAIAGLTGTSGFLKKTAANTWSLDTNTYLTTGTAASTYQPLDSDLTAIAAISTGTGLLKRSVSGSTVSWSIDTNTYLTGNQTITLSGDVTGSGTTAITTTIGAGKVTNAMLAGSIANSKLANSAIIINGSSTSLGGSFNTASITAGTAGTSGATSGYTLAVPYVTVNKYGIVTGYGTHTHTVNSIPNSSLANSSITIGSTAISLGGTAASLAGLTNVSMSGKLTIGSAEITYDATNGYLYINKPLVTAGDQIVISGTPGGGGGGGATTLAGLDDVAITSVSNGQLLQYNGSKWVNVAASSVGGVTSVAGYTGAVTAAQISSAIGLSDYLPLSAGSSKPLTNDLYITGGNGRVVLGGVVQYNYSNTMKLLGPASGFSGDLGWYDGANWYKVYHAGNFVAGTNYVAPQTTLTGYGITDALKIKSLDNSDVLLSNKVFSAGTTNKGDFSAQTECPTKYGAYISIQYDTSKNQGFQIYGDTNPATNGNTGIYYRARLAGDANTTYKAWRRVLDEANYSSYALPIAGGQINGTTASPLTINTTASNNYLYFATGGTSRGNIGYYSATIGMVFQCGDSYINIADGGELKKNNAYTFWHSGNYTTWINTTNFPGLNKTGTVTSVALTVPTGLSVSGTPITTSGTLAISLASGYSIPTTVKQSNWDTAYGWGNHASAGYLLATTAASTYVKKAGDTMSGNLTINGLSDGENVSPLIINDAYASATWARFIQALYPNIPVGGIPNLYFGKAATTRNGGVIAFYYAGSGSTSNLLTLGLHSVDHVLSVSGAGNVGIGYGTTPATYKLDVHKSGSSSGDVMRVSSEVSWANISYEASGTNRWAVGANQYGFGWWYEGLNDFAVFDTSGHLGIGTMTPHRDLDVVGVIQAGDASYNAVLEAQTDGAALSFWGYGSSAWHKGYIDASTLLINTRASGNVGIGTSSPSQKLHVAGVIRSKGSSGSGIDIGVDSNAIEGTTSSGYGDLYLQYFSTGKLVLCNGGGNVGIGITPSYKLHVNGTVGCGGLYCASTSSTAFAQVVNNTTMNWPISMSVMTPNLPVNGTHGFMVGRANSSGNTGIVSFRYVGAASTGNSVSLGFHTKDFIINAFYSGNVTIGTENTTDYGQKLYVAGNILSTGDQIVSSDLTLKENLTPVTYSVSDIAKARAVEFDWKDGRGHSMGSIAQDWLGIAPALVHGEEGNMSLAYGQLALVNTIIEAREIETLKARVAELEAEVKRLRMN